MNALKYAENMKSRASDLEGEAAKVNILEGFDNY